MLVRVRVQGYDPYDTFNGVFDRNKQKNKKLILLHEQQLDVNLSDVLCVVSVGMLKQEIFGIVYLHII